MNKNVGGRSVVGMTGEGGDGDGDDGGADVQRHERSLVVAAPAKATDGTHDSAVSATAIWRKRDGPSDYAG